MAGEVEREPASGVGGEPYPHITGVGPAGEVDGAEGDSQLLLPSSSSRSSLYFKGCLAGSSFVGRQQFAVELFIAVRLGVRVHHHPLQIACRTVCLVVVEVQHVCDA